MPSNTDTLSHLLTLNLYFRNQLLPLHPFLFRMKISCRNSWKITHLQKEDQYHSYSLWACIFISFLFQSVHSSLKPEQQQCKPQVLHFLHGMPGQSPHERDTEQQPELQQAAFTIGHPSPAAAMQKAPCLCSSDAKVKSSQFWLVQRL